MTEHPVSELLPQLLGGDPEAARAVFDRYSARLVRLADQHLSRKLAGRVDGEDVVQSVFRTFFRRGNEGEFQHRRIGPALAVAGPDHGPEGAGEGSAPHGGHA